MDEKIFKAGFGRVNITPSYGTPIIGYYIERKVEGVLDELEATAVAVSCSEDKAVLVSVDICELDGEDTARIREAVCKATGISEECIFIHATHTHTGPGASLTYGKADELLQEYMRGLIRKSRTRRCLR